MHAPLQAQSPSPVFCWIISLLLSPVGVERAQPTEGSQPRSPDPLEMTVEPDCCGVFLLLLIHNYCFRTFPQLGAKLIPMNKCGSCSCFCSRCCLFAARQGNCVHILLGLSIIFSYWVHKIPAETFCVFIGEVHGRRWVQSVRVYTLFVFLFFSDLGLKGGANVTACLWRDTTPHGASREAGAS